MADLIKMKGYIESIIFQNVENGYMVCNFIDNETNESYTCVGNIIGVSEGENVCFWGYDDEHTIYGEQFKVNKYEKIMPKTCEEIEKYLSSGIIKGVGPKTAESIVKEFGEDTFNVIENEYIKLSKIKGISNKKALEISINFIEQNEMRDTIMKLLEYGISNNMSIKIYSKYKNRSIEIVENNPYDLIKTINNIGFKIADNIAMNVGIISNDINRIMACIDYVISDYSMNGHIYIKKDILKKKVIDILKVDQSMFNDAYDKLLEMDDVVEELDDEDKIVYSRLLYLAQRDVAEKIVELSHQKYEYDKNKTKKRIKKIEDELKIKLAKKQKEAIFRVIENGISVITGGPGTGKTTLINAIIRMFEEEGKEVVLAAPTGRAAKRMTEATVRESKTIHRLLEVKTILDDKQKQRFEKCETNPIEADVIILDEVSMIDIYLMNSFLKAVLDDTRIILVGDHNQLPSVGPGNVLKDIIGSDLVEVVELTEVFRQAEKSDIVKNAHMVNNGVKPKLDNKSEDFFFIKRNNYNEIIDEMKNLLKDRLPNFLECDVKDIQILTPMRKNSLGSENLNKIFQDIINPNTRYSKEITKKNKRFRIKDKVMQVKNNYSLEWKKEHTDSSIIENAQGIYNGDQGVILDICESMGIMKILFDNEKIVDYPISNCDELELAYAITIHKSQGSEYPSVVIPILDGPYILFTRNLLYTAITRAKKAVIIVGSKEKFYKMIDNNKIQYRNSKLEEKIVTI